MHNPSDITLYVPYYNARDTIEAVLDGIEGQTVSPGTVLVVDDGSEEPLQTSRARVIRHDTNRGLAAARNTALQRCQTPLLAALDADVVPCAEWLEALLDTLNRTGADGVGGRLDERFQDTLADCWRSVHMAQHWGDQAVEQPRFLYGANTLFRVSALQQAGGYDERYRTNDEDRTISDAVYAEDGRLVYTPSARCEHLRRDTVHTILCGYWQWHRTRGIMQGDFDRPDGLLPRIELVNFGIFRYRFDMDVQQQRHAFLALDSMIPWVFCACDLLLLRQRLHIPVPRFPDERLLENLRPDAIQAIRQICPPCGAESSGPAWFARYYERFRFLMDSYGWYSQAHDDASIWPALLDALTL
jgi:glycosyltransferase involved in cell wall biosynthesis